MTSNIQESFIITILGFFCLSLKKKSFTRRVWDNLHEYAGSLLTGRLMYVSTKGLAEDKIHFGVFTLFFTP